MARATWIVYPTLAVLPALWPTAPAHSSHLPAIGSGGGAPYERLCAPGEFLTGFEGRAGLLVDQFRIACGRVDRGRVLFGRPRAGAIGRSLAGLPVAFGCPAGAAVNAARWATSSGPFEFLNNVDLECRYLATPDAPGPRVSLASGPRETCEVFGCSTFGATSGWTRCAPGELAIGVHGLADVFIHRIGLVCAPIPVSEVVACQSCHAGKGAALAGPIPAANSPDGRRRSEASWFRRVHWWRQDRIVPWR